MTSLPMPAAPWNLNKTNSSAAVAVTSSSSSSSSSSVDPVASVHAAAERARIELDMAGATISDQERVFDVVLARDDQYPAVDVDDAGTGTGTGPS